MSPDVLLLVLLASVLHASWNYLAKTVPSGAPFVWLTAVVMSILLLPLAAGYVWFYGFVFTPETLAALLLTGILHLVYFLVLQVGYQRSDLSVVYPLARGSGPVFATLGAVLFIGEQVSLQAILGLCLVVSGVLFISGIAQGDADRKKVRTGVAFGLGIGILIASYTVWDGYAVKKLGLAPILLEYSANPIRIVALAPVAWRRWPEVRTIWTEHYLKILAVGIMAPLGYILILYAMKYAPVHLVAPTRELSIVLGVVFGAKLLTEQNFRPRLIGALLIVGGIVFLSQ
ncbi:MAG: EamA family transporter [Bacteroidetes bacterium]|nr:MAG: EamA family transporter [Bacteroidota bacterium]